jgi:hypothetical protein
MALKIDNEIVHTVATETIMQNVDAFTAGTRGAITLGTQMISGDMLETSMLAEIASLIARRDIASDAAATVKTVDSRDENTIKVYWGTGAIEFKSVDAKRYGTDAGAFSAAIGEQIGKGIISYALNAGIAAVRASIQAGGYITGDGIATITPTLLNSSLKTFGDAQDSIVSFVMNGATYNDLVGSAIASTSSSVAYGAIYEGATGSLGRPVFVTDAAGLAMTVGSEAGTAVLGLTMDAVSIIESESRDFMSEMVSGGENIKYRIQAEGSYALNVKGYSWKAASGTNPTIAAVGTAANWEKKATNVKSTAGVILFVA